MHCVINCQYLSWSFPFFQPIIPDKSEVKLMGTKVEIILKKAEAFSWPSLEYKEQKEQKSS